MPLFIISLYNFISLFVNCTSPIYEIIIDHTLKKKMEWKSRSEIINIGTKRRKFQLYVKETKRNIQKSIRHRSEKSGIF